ncbi:DUF4126 family protein [Svornostia abyssi]|uniref:DUF4126 family protein n=1 Tax=Svornostia abyssi TaxID=2898438 RepID=A0ABY5PJ69_9ACTN|nr:DUF4126 family protein [Parviterribacteraceae bacterium J379]
MNFLLDLLQGAGVGGASGIRPFLPTLVTGGLATADVAVDFEGTAFSFLESPVFLIVIVFAAAVTVALEQRGKIAEPLGQGLLVIGVVLGALLAAGSLDDRADIWWPGLLVGGAAAVLLGVASRQLLGRVAQRLGEEERSFLLLYAAGTALLVTAASLLFPPLALVALVVAAWLLVASRKRAGEKYAGLRILNRP